LKEKEVREVKEVKEFFRTSYDGLMHEDIVPVDEFGEPIEGSVIHRTVQVHAEMHEIKVGGGSLSDIIEDATAPLKKSDSDHRSKIEDHLKALMDGG
jgi:hypothetical protein